jgi:hypothetical protein
MAFLRASKQNLIIKSKFDDLEENNDLSQNLIKILCAILNVHFQPNTSQYLDDKLLFTYLDSINFQRDDSDLVLID